MLAGRPNPLIIYYRREQIIILGLLLLSIAKVSIAVFVCCTVGEHGIKEEYQEKVEGEDNKIYYVSLHTECIMIILLARCLCV